MLRVVAGASRCLLLDAAWPPTHRALDVSNGCIKVTSAVADAQLFATLGSLPSLLVMSSVVLLQERLADYCFKQSSLLITQYPNVPEGCTKATGSSLEMFSHLELLVIPLVA